MPDLPISGLSTDGPITDADLFVAVQAGTTYKLPATAIRDYMENFSITNPLSDDVSLVWGTTSPFSVTNLTAGSGDRYSAITVPSSTNIQLFTLEANKGYDYLNGLAGGPIAPTFLFTSDEQNQNTFAYMQLNGGADRRLSIGGLDGDSIDGTTQNAAGISIATEGGGGGTLGGDGGSLYQRTGRAHANNDDGGNIYWDFGVGDGTGLTGSVKSTGANSDLRFRKTGTGKLKLFAEVTDNEYISLDVVTGNATIGSSSSIISMLGAIHVDSLGAGSSTFNHTVNIGGTANTAHQLLIDQTALTATVDTQALRAKAGAHTNMTNLETADYMFNNSATFNFAGGGAKVQPLRSFVVGHRTYTAGAAQTVGTAATVHIDGPPEFSTNITGDAAVGLLVNSFSVTGYKGNAVVGMGFGVPGIANGEGNVLSRVGTFVVTGGANLSLGDQTATLDTLTGYYMSGNTLISTTNTRTVGRVANYLSDNVYTVGANVVVTNGPYNFYAANTGPNRFDGFVVGSQVSVASANDITAVTNSIYVTGAVQINRIAAPPSPSSCSARLVLIFASNPVVSHNVASGGGFYSILLNGSVNFNTAANSVLELQWDTTNLVWQEVSRKSA